MKKLKILGIGASITFVMFLALAFLVKSLGVLFQGWFETNALAIAIVSGVIILIGVLTGAITISAMTSKGKSLFG